MFKKMFRIVTVLVWISLVETDNQMHCSFWLAKDNVLFVEQFVSLPVIFGLLLCLG